MVEESVQLLFGNNHSQLITTVNDEYDGVAFSKEHMRRQDYWHSHTSMF